MAIEDLAVHRRVCLVGGHDFAAGLGASALLGHALVEAGAIDLDTAFLGDLGGDLDRETERVVKQERDLAADAAGRELLVQHRRAVAQRLAEPLFFAFDDARGWCRFWRTSSGNASALMSIAAPTSSGRTTRSTPS